MSLRTFAFSVLTLISCLFLQTQADEPRLTHSDILRGQQLALNGAGSRKEYFVEFYQAELYLPETSADPKAIIGADQPMAMRLEITSRLLSSERMTGSIEEGFYRSLGDRIEFFREEIDSLKTAFGEDIRAGDIFEIYYFPGEGVSIASGGKIQLTVGGLAFKSALWRIWLGENSVDRKLRAKLLGID